MVWTQGLAARSGRVIGVLGAALIAVAAAAQPVWQFNPANGLNAMVNVTATYGGSQPAADAEIFYAPGYSIGPEVYDFGSDASASSVLSGAGWSLSASGVSVIAIRGLNTPTVEIYYRVSALDDASAPPLPTPYSTDSTASLDAFLPLEVGGAPPNTSYHVACQYEYFGNGVTIAELGQDDHSRAQSYFALTNGVGGFWPVIAGYYEGTNSGGTQTGNLGAIAGHDLPAQPATLYASVNFTSAHTDMSSPGNGTFANEDLCGAEFYARVTLTIGAVCPRPTISPQPVNTPACPLGQASLTVGASGGGPYTYRWEYEYVYPGGSDWIGLADGPFPLGGQAVVSGSQTDSLTISSADDTSATRYRVFVGNQCGGRFSVPARLTIDPGACPQCDPDVNCDGSINGFDIEATEQAVNGDFSNFCQASADLNGDGAENGFDIETEEQRVNGAPC
ncbi:hypothetical protein PHYC_00297 [Phycisphaerales bacterium]|nr:hypothetical protein PHYC_00297 [Phycisphaerales bacterium]